MTVELEWDGPTIRELLDQVVALLESNGERFWATYFLEARELLATSVERAIAIVLQSNGGMGSFNDLVLQRPQGPLIAENEQLDQLRGELYDRCRTLRQRFNRMDNP